MLAISQGLFFERTERLQPNAGFFSRIFTVVNSVSSITNWDSMASASQMNLGKVFCTCQLAPYRIKTLVFELLFHSLYSIRLPICLLLLVVGFFRERKPAGWSGMELLLMLALHKS
ncbi:Hypothetical predicted protein [Octopus vulgaris]|uniref:Uncharacterized protein n=1 Tax=Octopus vulgaris TaxID=6645 RepID=A0AA36BAJ5_OCTVU|nr:Hypothetical predicted protein [Octopus vulgaris]